MKTIRELSGTDQKQIAIPATGKNADETEDNSVYELQIFKLNFALLTYSGLWIPESSSKLSKILYNVFPLLQLTHMAVTIGSQVIAMVIYWGNMRVITYTLGTTMGCVITCCDYINFMYRKRTVLEMVHHMKTEFIAKMRPKYRNLLDSTEREAKFLTILRVVLAVLAITSAGLLPIINKDASAVDIDFKNMTTEQIITEKLVLVMYIPFEFRESPQYEMTFLYQILSASMMVFSSQSVDLLLMILMSLLAARFKILGKLLDEMNENISEDKINYEDYILPDDFSAHSSNFEGIPDETALSGDKDDPFRLYLVDCIRQHESAIQFTYKLNNVVSIAGMLQMINIPIMMCATGYQVTQGLNINEFCKFLTLLVLIMYKLFVYCWFGQDVLDQSEAVQTSLYGTDWYKLKNSYKSLIPTMLMRATRAVKLRNGVFNELHFASYSAVLNTAYSYIALLRQFNE